MMHAEEQRTTTSDEDVDAEGYRRVTLDDIKRLVKAVAEANGGKIPGCAHESLMLHRVWIDSPSMNPDRHETICATEVLLYETIVESQTKRNSQRSGPFRLLYKARDVLEQYIPPRT